MKNLFLAFTILVMASDITAQAPDWIWAKSAGGSKNATIKIIDLHGKEIREIKFSGRQLILEKGDMQAGMYFVHLIDENKNVMSKRILIE